MMAEIGSVAAIGAEDVEMAPERPGVAVVQVEHRPVQAHLQAFADVVAGPVGVHEVGGAARAQPPAGAGRPGRVQAHRHDLRDLHSALTGGQAETLLNLPQANRRALLRPRRVLAQALDQEPLVRVDERVIDGGPAQIHSSQYRHSFPLRLLKPRLLVRAGRAPGLPRMEAPSAGAALLRDPPPRPHHLIPEVPRQRRYDIQAAARRTAQSSRPVRFRPFHFQLRSLPKRAGC